MSETHNDHVHAVVTGAKSRSHVLYIASYLRRVLQDVSDAGRLRVSFVPAAAFLTAPAVGVEDARALLPDDPRLSLEEGMAGWRFAEGARALYVSVGTPGLKALVALRRANGVRPIHVVVTDEGIGTYGSWTTRRDAIRRQGAAPVTATLKACLIAATGKALTSERWPAYRRTSHGWEVTKAVRAEFRAHTEGASRSVRRSAVILTQPFVDLGLIDEKRYVDYVRGLVASCADAGLEPLVRAHPAENVRRYDEFEVMRSRGTAELDPLVVGADAVLGGPSTALINLSAMFGANVVWVSEPSLTFLDTDVSEAQRQIFAAFLGRPVRPVDVAARLA